MGNRLGQHFLINKAKIRRVIEALELKAGDTVVEIGPGHGELTKELMRNRGVRIIAIEKDKELARTLRNSIENNADLIEIIEGDALKLIPKIIENYKLKANHYKLAGNIPYYITGKLLRVIGELPRKPKNIVLTIQKEVAERIIAAPPRMNLLAASVQFWAKPKIVGFISKKSFRPAPKIDSAIIKLITYDQKLMTDYSLLTNYYKLIKILFKQPRKTILNNLSASFEEKKGLAEALKKNKADLNARPQNLSVETIKTLAQMLYN